MRSIEFGRDWGANSAFSLARKQGKLFELHHSKVSHRKDTLVVHPKMFIQAREQSKIVEKRVG